MWEQMTDQANIKLKLVDIEFYNNAYSYNIVKVKITLSNGQASPEFSSARDNRYSLSSNSMNIEDDSNIKHYEFAVGNGNYINGIRFFDEKRNSLSEWNYYFNSRNCGNYWKGK